MIAYRLKKDIIESNKGDYYYLSEDKILGIGHYYKRKGTESPIFIKEYMDKHPDFFEQIEVEDYEILPDVKFDDFNLDLSANSREELEKMVLDLTKENHCNFINYAIKQKFYMYESERADNLEKQLKATK